MDITKTLEVGLAVLIVLLIILALIIGFKRLKQKTEGQDKSKDIEKGKEKYY